MEIVAKLLHSSCMTYMPTNLPVQYYGLPDGNVYIVYSRFYDTGINNSGIEYVLAVHQEFSYNYEEKKIVSNDNSTQNFTHNSAILDKQHPRFKVIKVYKGINSFSEAFSLLNKKAFKILSKLIRHK